MLEKTAVPEIQSGVRVVYNLSQDAILREMARVTEKRVLDERSALKHATNEGIEIGRAAGFDEGRVGMISALRDLGIDEDTIMRAVQKAETYHGNN